MQNLEDLKGKKILIVGLGKTGCSLAQFLVEQGAQVTINDHKSRPELASQLEQLQHLPIKFELGGHSPKFFQGQELIVLSPGIPSHLKLFEYARSQGIRVTGEFELISRFIREPIVAVTGTNGKTTTLRLIEAMLKKSGINCWVGGALGPPLTEYLRQLANGGPKASAVLCEVSSYMLETCETFSPSHIIFTNLAENHLDRYRTMEDYISAKRRIFRNTTQATTSVLNADDGAVVELARDPSVQRGRICYFSRKPQLEPQIMNIGGVVSIGQELRVRVGPEIETFNTRNMSLRGRHSLENMMAALLVAKEYGATREAIQTVIDTFKGLPHRLEYVRKVGGVQFFNDSKGTNTHAVLRALDAFDENVILIAGGKEVGTNFEVLRSPVRRKVKTLILMGEAKEKINRDLGDFSETFLIGTFEEAVLIAYQKSRIGDVVLLSPGCPSFDMFDSYEERGNYFKEIVRKFS